MWVNRDDVRRFGLSEADIARAGAEARAKVERRLAKLRGGRSTFVLKGRTAIVVDDGIAAGSTMRAAVAALRRLDTGRIVIAVPTGSARSVGHVAAIVDEVCCANLRRGPSFAVADAYERWYDVSEDEVAAILAAAAANA